MPDPSYSCCASLGDTELAYWRTGVPQGVQSRYLGAWRALLVLAAAVGMHAVSMLQSDSGWLTYDLYRCQVDL
jgi:hypothetical protein